MNKRICKLCGKEFIPKSFNQYICNENHLCKCVICGNQFKPSVYQKRNFIKTGIIGTCSNKCSKQLALQTKIEKYGSGNNSIKIKETYSNMSEEEKYKKCVEKTQTTKLEKYGNKNYNNNQKMLQTKLEKYGNKNYNNIEKIKETHYNKNNGKYYSEKTIKQIISTRILKYGKGNNGDKISKSLLAKNELERNIAKTLRRNTNTIRYGTPNYAQSLLDKHTLDILNNKDKFLEICEQNKDTLTLTGLAKILKVSDNCVSDYYYKYKCNELYPLKQPSYIEDEICKLLDEYKIKYEKHNRKILAPKELDIFIPEYNLAIECNGTFWHSTYKITDYKYHYNKSKMCEEKGIRLIHIFEYEWNNKRQRPILENIIKSALGITETIYARKCKVIIKKSNEMRTFFETNNIQGFRPGKFAICLELNGEIVMSYIFGHCYFGRGKYECEVIRGATKLGYTIVGGASKIFKYFVENYDYNNCVYYIDYNYFNGNSLKNLPNMKFIKTQYSFKNYWKKENIVKSREPKRNSEIKELYKSGDVYKIYNAGTKVYVWER